MDMPTIAIIGAGNMGASLMGGFIRHGYPADKLCAVDKDAAHLQMLAEKLNIQTSTDALTAASQAKVIIFAVKPNGFEQAALAIKPALQHLPLIISVAAGIKMTSISHWLGQDMPIIRTMPNTPALIGCGATALVANAKVSAEQKDLAESLLRAVGIVEWIKDEAQMDTVTALSGSGPAYFFLVMEAMQAAAESQGLSPEVAKMLTLQTALGAARMAMESESSLIDLRHHVTSPGGTTEKAINVLEEHDIKGIFKQAIEAARQRSQELAKILGEDHHA